MASLLKAPVAAHLHRQLVSDPLLFVTGLPASPAVEYMLSLPAESPTDSAALIHEGSHATIDLHPGRVTSCRNRPALLAAANDPPTDAPDDFIPLLVTNPATPRTPHVQHLTRMVDRTAVVQAFATQYTSPRRAEFNWKEHGDLLQMVESAPELGALLESASRDWQWAVDPRFPRHRLLPKTLERHTETWAFKLGPVRPDGTLRIKTPIQPETLGLRRTSRPLPRRLIKLWRRRPDTLTPSEKAEGAQLHAVYAEPDPRWEAITSAPTYAAGTHMLDIHAYGWRPQGCPEFTWPIPAPVPVERWATDAAASDYTGPAGFTSAGRHALAKAAGHLAASKLGLQNPSRWAVLVSLMEEQWDGTFPELLETVQATA